MQTTKKLSIKDCNFLSMGQNTHILKEKLIILLIVLVHGQLTVRQKLGCQRNVVHERCSSHGNQEAEREGRIQEQKQNTI